MIDHETPGVAETARRIARGETTARDVTAAALARIGERDPELNAFSVVLERQALAEASARDATQAAGVELGPLHGVPIVIKEELDVAGTVTTFGGRGNSTPVAADGEVVRRLRAAGAVVVGKSTMPEFGAWPYTESEDRGVTRNPWDRTRTPGGSSGGTAVAVSSGMVPVGLGGDGGGSIRIPSACCGLFGLKPQRGRVTTAPHPHLWWALGTVGPLARSVLDSALVYDVIRGSQDGDLYRAGETGSFVAAAGREPGRLRIGWSTKPVTKGVRPDPAHVQAVKDTARLLADLGHDVVEVDPGYPDPTLAFVPQFFAGIRTESDEVEHYDRLERRTRATYRLGSWVTPRVVDRALAMTETVAEKANRVFDRVDVLLTPTMAHRPPATGVLMNARTPAGAALRSMPAIAYLALWNVAGNPAASVPRGIGTDGLPLAVQLVGPTDGEERLLSLSAQIEQTRSLAAGRRPVRVRVMGAIEVTDLAMAYGELRAVDGVSFEVAEGEFFGILGPNGAGKTTTLEMIEGLRKPDAGTIRVLGESPWPRNAALLPRIGVQLQASSFFERLTAREQIHTFACAVRRRRPPAATSGWSRSGWSTRPTPASRTSRAGRRNGCRSPARWSTTRSWSSSTSRPRRSTRRRAATCGTCCPASARPAAPSCSPPTTWTRPRCCATGSRSWTTAGSSSSTRPGCS